MRALTFAAVGVVGGCKRGMCSSCGEGHECEARSHGRQVERWRQPRAADARAATQRRAHPGRVVPVGASFPVHGARLVRQTRPVREKIEVAMGDETPPKGRAGTPGFWPTLPGERERL